MLIRSAENKPTELLIPEGAWEKALLTALASMEAPFEERPDRCYVFALPTLEMLVSINRAKSIPLNLRKKDNTAVLGITGLDVAIEYDLTSRTPFLSANEERKLISLPIPQAKLAWMLTPNAEKKFGEKKLMWDNLLSGVIFASYPQIAADYLSQMKKTTLPVYEEFEVAMTPNLPPARIEKISGKVEAQWRNTPTNYLVADVIEEGKTMKANGLEEYTTIMRSVPPILLTDKEKACETDMSRREDLLTLLLLAKQKRDKAREEKE